MLIGLMADSHDRVPAIRELLERMIERGVGMVLHAGDYCSPFSLSPFLELNIPFAGVFGRNDGDREGLKAFAANALSPSRSPSFRPNTPANGMLSSRNGESEKGEQ